MVAANVIPQFDYTTKDFLAFKALMRAYIELNYPQITNFNDSSENSMLIEIQALFGDILMFYFDRQSNENILATARRRQSVIDIVQTIDYQLATALPATVDLQITIDPTNIAFPGYPAEVPARFQVSNAGNGASLVFYETALPLIFLSSTTVLSIGAFQGQTIYETGGNKVATSDGSQSQSYILSTAGIIVPASDTDFIQQFSLTVNGIPWSRTTDFADANSTDTVFTLTVNETGFGTVTFGNGNLGKIPPATEVIEATYRVGGGVAGRVGATSLTKIVSNLPWVTAVTNPEGSSGGTDADTIASAKVNAPKSLRTLNRAVSDQDHEDISDLIPGVAKSKTVPHPGTLEIDIYIAPVGGGTPSTTLINQVLTQFAISKMSPTIVRAFVPFYQPVNVIYSLTVQAGFKQADVAASVLAVVSGLLAFENMDFGTGIELGDVYAKVVGANGIAGVKTFLVKKFAIDPVFRPDVTNTGTPTFSTVTIYPSTNEREYLLQMTSSTAFKVTENELGTSTTISGTQLQDTNVSWLLDTGTSTSVGSTFLRDSTQVFQTNVFSGQTLIDSANTPFLITGNNTTQINVSAGTPAVGVYQIVRRFVGKTLNPSDSNSTVVNILANTANTITTDTVLSNLANVGDEYQIQTLQTATGVIGTTYEDDNSTIAFTVSSGSIAPVIGDNWTMRTSQYLSDINTPNDVILEEGTITTSIFGGEM